MYRIAINQTKSNLMLEIIGNNVQARVVSYIPAAIHGAVVALAHALVGVLHLSVHVPAARVAHASHLAAHHQPWRL